MPDTVATAATDFSPCGKIADKGVVFAFVDGSDRTGRIRKKVLCSALTIRQYRFGSGKEHQAWLGITRRSEHAVVARLRSIEGIGDGWAQPYRRQGRNDTPSEQAEG